MECSKLQLYVWISGWILFVYEWQAIAFKLSIGKFSVFAKKLWTHFMTCRIYNFIWSSVPWIYFLGVFPSSVFFAQAYYITRANWGGDSFESNSLSFYEVINSVRYTLYFHNISDQKKKKKRPKRLKLYIIIIFFWWGFFFCGGDEDGSRLILFWIMHRTK